MGTLRTKTIEPATGSTLTLGASGDSITVSSDSIKTNTFKDAGGNTLFTSDGSGTLSSVNAGLAGGAGPILISTNTITSNTASSEFTSGIDGTYDEYMFVIYDMRPVTGGGDTMGFQCSIDGGSNYNVAVTNTYFDARHDEAGNNGALAYQAGYDQANGTAYIGFAGSVDNAADAGCSGILHLFSPSNTTFVKNWYCRIQNAGDYPTANTSCVDNFTAGYFNTTSAINAISFSGLAGNILTSTIQMYGIK